MDDALRAAEGDAKDVRGAAVTPFLLSRLAGLTNGRSLVANRALIVANAGLAARVSVASGAIGPTDHCPFQSPRSTT